MTSNDQVVDVVVETANLVVDVNDVTTDIVAIDLTEGLGGPPGPMGPQGPPGEGNPADAAPPAVAAAGAIGVSTDYAREDHTHAGPQASAATPAAVAVAGAAGAAAAWSRGDHAHAGPQASSTVPANVAAASAVGAGTTWAKGDHVHGYYAGPINLTHASATADLLTLGVTGDAQKMLIVNTNGVLEWGPGGSGPQDINFYRSASAQLRTNGSLVVDGNSQTKGNTYIGDPLDTFLYRTAVSELKTDANFTAGSRLTVGPGTPDATSRINTSGSTTFVQGSEHVYTNVAANFNAAASVTGTLVITLPKGFSSEMVSFTIRGFSYASGSWELVVGGYTYTTGTAWLSPGCSLTGAPPFSSVRLGFDGSKLVILLGTVATVWQYPQVVISELRIGYGGGVGWGTDAGWSFAYVTNEAAYTNVVSPPRSSPSPYLDRRVLAADAASISIAGIPTTLRDVKLKISARVSAGSAVNMAVRINGDATAGNYTWGYTQMNCVNGTPTSLASASDVWGIAGLVLDTTGNWSTTVIEFTAWSNPHAGGLSYTFMSHAALSSTSNYVLTGGGVYKPSAAYDTIAVYTGSGVFKSGSEFTLMGTF